MALEVINDGTAHPARLEAVLRYCQSFEEPQRERDVGNATMPTTNPAERSMLKDVLKHLQGMDLIKLKNDVIQIDSNLRTDDARDLIRQRVLTPKNDDNGLFARYFAWLLHHSGAEPEEGFDLQSGEEKAALFNREMSPDSDDRKFNDVKERSFRIWAQYLGLGCYINKNFIPLPIEVIECSLSQIFKKTNELSAPIFFRNLSDIYPFLDRGLVFSDVDKLIGNLNTISPSVSSCIRVLHDEEVIELVSTTDAPEQVRLSPDQLHPISGAIHSVRLVAR